MAPQIFNNVNNHARLGMVEFLMEAIFSVCDNTMNSHWLDAVPNTWVIFAYINHTSEFWIPRWSFCPFVGSIIKGNSKLPNVKSQQSRQGSLLLTRYAGRYLEQVQPETQLPSPLCVKPFVSRVCKLPLFNQLSKRDTWVEFFAHAEDHPCLSFPLGLVRLPDPIMIWFWS